MNQYRTDMIDTARRFVDSNLEHVLYMTDAKAWFSWDGKRYVPDIGDVQERAKEAVLAYYKDASSMTGYDGKGSDARVSWAKEAAGRLSSVLRAAASDPRVRARNAEMDANPYLLNTPTGVVDLSTGNCRDAVPADRMTKLTGAAYIEDPNPGVWAQFLDKVLPDPELQDFAQRVAGYTAIGITMERLLVLPIGPTGTGKSKLLAAIEAALGDYAVVTDSNLFLANARDQYSLADLPGARFVAASEFDETQKVNRSLVKRFTGGDVMTARPIYGKPFQFGPVGTMWIATNEMPFVGDDEASWGRILPIPFVQSGWRLDGNIDELLRTDEARSEVLAWIVRGAQQYLDNPGLYVPDEVASTGNTLRQDQRHHVALFVEDALEIVDEGQERTGEMYAAYQAWCKRNGETPVANRMLTKHLKKRGLGAGVSNSVRYIIGARILPAARVLPSALERGA